MSARCCGWYGRYECDECPTGPQPADDASLVAGATRRGLLDASEAYARRLADRWRSALSDVDP